MLTRRLPSICDHVCGRDTCSIIGGIGSHVVDYAMSVDARKAPKKKKDKAAAAAAAAPFDGAAFIKYLIDAMASSHTAGSNAVIVFRLRRSCRHIPMFCAAIRVKLLSRCTLVAPRIPAPLTVVVRCGRCILGWPGAVVWRAFVAVGVGGAVSAVHLRGRVWTTGTPPPTEPLSSESNAVVLSFDDRGRAVVLLFCWTSQTSQPLPVRMSACQSVSRIMKKLPIEVVSPFLPAIMTHALELVVVSDDACLDFTLGTLFLAIKKGPEVSPQTMD